MIIEYYPESIGNEDDARVKKFIKKELKKYPHLKLLVEDFLKKVKENNDLAIFFKAKSMKKLGVVPINRGQEKTILCEMRIPPERKGGVVRIYFIRKKDDGQRILLLDGEVKHEIQSSKIENMSDLTWPLNY